MEAVINHIIFVLSTAGLAYATIVVFFAVVGITYIAKKLSTRNIRKRTASKELQEARRQRLANAYVLAGRK